MKIKYIGNDPAHRLKVDNSYEVVSVDFIRNTENADFITKYRIVNEHGTPALYDSAFFEMEDSNIDSDFVYKPYREGSFGLIPEVMSYENFWDDFFNLNEEAITILKKRFDTYKDVLFA